ncbi:MAG: DEAD/DEAH box helicase family protein [Prevotella sp.]|nr:DEAD/DEAH box helicase family protein [Prevotella sp.]
MKKYGINEVLVEIRETATSEREKGAEFEGLIQKWLKTDPRYSSLVKVWLWDEFPSKIDFGVRDLGIDLVAKTDIGDYWAIQCKCYDEYANIDRPAVESFLANASRQFRDEETLQTKEFSNLVWVSTTRKRWGANAEEAIQGLRIPFTRINLFELENSPVDWHALYHGDKEGKAALLPGKQIRPDQTEALLKAHEHFIEQGNDRGKLIMACGTGKTFTSLKIMESLTETDALVLFFVPSIALMGQTLNAWMADKTDDIRAICVCSDARVTRKMRDEDDIDESVVDLAVPATTNTESIVRQIRRAKHFKARTVIFSTYQSIESVSTAMKTSGVEAALCICDEAHRTTGVKIPGLDESNFTKVHDNKIIPAKKRLYMTATPRLYKESARIVAKEKDYILCSMDDEELYGKEFYRLTFSNAVSKGLLTDYKVLVLTVSNDDIPESIRTEINKKNADAAKDEKLKELNFDDATKLVGCINGLSKRIIGDNGVTYNQDPIMMKRAVAFCRTINPTPTNPNASSRNLAKYFGDFCDEYKKTLSQTAASQVVNVSARHIDGTMDANERNNLIAWLKGESSDPYECRILCNVRCLSEGVDVPALDAVLFLSPRNSEIEVVQSVGRVMRSFKGKKYGYIIIPVIVPENVSPEAALNDNERFKVVWTILNALRSHDENFNAHVNQIHLNKKRPEKIVVGGVPKNTYSMTENGDVPEGNDGTRVGERPIPTPIPMLFGNLQDAIYARLVEKVGDKLYWENWAKQIGEIAKMHIASINTLVAKNERVRQSFEVFVKGLQENINPSVDNEQAIEMLAQHIITQPVFDALFHDYEFVNKNVVSISMESMKKELEDNGFELHTEILDKFYDSVKNNVGNIDNFEGKQTIIKNLYEKFFKGAFKKTVEKLGIVYTPVECVDFIIRSVDDLLKKEFNTCLTNENVHILDPFTGTGTFITRLLQLGVIKREDMERKYLNEIHCNEIVLLAYYVADVNIESVYHEIMRPKEYLPYDGICLTDTFQLGEDNHNEFFTEYFQDNSERVKKQKKIPVRVIIGNPPYSVGMRAAEDNAPNLPYPILDKAIADTYVKHSNCRLNRSTYDTYIKAFRWASDRIPNTEGGMVAFISNGSWLDSKAQDGFRRCIENEFSSIYVLNLRGNQRTSGELSRREGGKIFGSGSRTPIAITFLVKNPAKTNKKAKIYYHDIGDYHSREQKLKMVNDFRSILSSRLELQTIVPNKKADWINQRDGLFDNFIPLSDVSNKKNTNTIFNNCSSRGVATARDSWCYNNNYKSLSENINSAIAFYNRQVDLFHNSKMKKPSVSITDVVDFDPTKFSWDRAQKESDLPRCRKYSFKEDSIMESFYRPFFKQYGYFDRQLNNCVYKMPILFPNKDLSNILICVSGPGVTKDFSCLITNYVTDLELIGKSLCFPLYYYVEDKNRKKQQDLFDNSSQNNFIRRDGISDWILKEVRNRYHVDRQRVIDKEMIFYYVYGILHSPKYRERFANDLRRSLPRIPIVEKSKDFIAFSDYGKKLAALHLNYEDVPKYDGVTVEGLDTAPQGDSEEVYNYFRILDKMRFKSKEDKSTIIYNGNIRITNIPAKAYEYVVNGKSAIEWIVERYCVSVDKRSGIKNDCNDWAREHGKPRYVLDLLLSVINVSVQTVDIVAKLPNLDLEL